MSFSTRTSSGGGGLQTTGVLSAQFNVTVPTHHPRPPLRNSTVSVTTFVTISSPVTTTATATTFETISTPGPTVTTTATVSASATQSLSPTEAAILSKNASLARTNIKVAGILGGLTIVIILLLALLFCFWINRRRREREREREEEESPPFTSLASRPPPGFLEGNMMSPPQSPQRIHATSLSMGPRSGGYAVQAFSSHPPNQPPRPLTAPVSQPMSSSGATAFGAVPAINVLPTTPSVIGRDDSSPAAPILQPGAARTPMYHEALQEEAAQSRSRLDAAQAGRLGLPVVERAPRVQHASRASVSTIGSDLGFGQAVSPPEPETNEHRGVLHSTRASSGVFPDA